MDATREICYVPRKFGDSHPLFPARPIYVYTENKRYTALTRVCTMRRPAEKMSKFNDRTRLFYKNYR